MSGKPPYTITEKAADYLAKIAEAATRLELATNFSRDLKLQRENRLRTIHSSLAIEGNSLSLHDVKAVMEGRMVAGSQEDIREVKNAYAAYDQIMRFDPYKVSDFLRAHQLMTAGLIAEAGVFRQGDVGVFDGHTAIHVGARPQFVHALIKDLFDWARSSGLHPVLKSAIIHYEIETIHPFADGNGRMGRLWQTLVLAGWKAVFGWIPMETVLYEKRREYYDAIAASRQANDSGAFIEFTLSALYSMIMSQTGMAKTGEHQFAERDDEFAEKFVEKFAVNSTQGMIMVLMARQPAISAKSIAQDLNMTPRGIQKNIETLKKRGLVERIGPAKGGHWVVKG